MSLTGNAHVQCPECGHEMDVVFYESINSMENPEIKGQIISGSFFQIKCEKCGAVTPLVYKTLFHEQGKYMIFLSLSDQDYMETTKAIASYRGEKKGLFGKKTFTGPLANYIFRIVKNQGELEEKIRILDAGLDDRVIEGTKLVTKMDVEKNLPEFVYSKIIFGGITENGDYRLFFVGKNDENLEATIPKSQYDSTAAYLLKKRPSIQEDDIVIDQRWVEKALEKLG